MDLYVDFTFTGQAGASSWGDFAKLHRMDEPLAAAYRYNAVVAAADGSLWAGVPTPPPQPTPAPAPPPVAPAPAPVVVTLSVTDATAAEAGRDPGVLRVTRSGPTASSLSVGYTVGGTAANGIDYERLRGTVVIPAGRASASIVVRPIDDAAIEDPEQVVVDLAAGAGYSLGATTSGAVSLLSNDRPTVTITATDPAAAEAGGDPGTLRVTRSGPTTSSLAVALAVGGTAAKGIDYERLPAIIVIPAGQASASVEVRPIDDAAVEPRESVIARVSAAPAYLVGKASAAVVQIADDDRPAPRPATQARAVGQPNFSAFAAAFAALVFPTETAGTKKPVGA
ncbi:MAG: hypothetical protein EBZ59_01620 [Planctomycetia bacterium]|nr:hypothetical protein [Planctomycetia bacterium]